MATCRIFAYALLACFIAYAAGQNEKCLNCICQREGCEDEVGKCSEDGKNCGPFQISEAYWKDCGKPGADWKTCAKELKCSRDCVKAYMDRYAKKCVGDKDPSCQDYARIHNGGPEGCNSPSTVDYWPKVEECCRSGEGVC